MGDTTVENDSDCDVDHGAGDVEDTARSATKCLRRFIGRPATPASWPPDQAGFFQPRVFQGRGQVHNRRGSNRRWMKVQWQVASSKPPERICARSLCRWTGFAPREPKIAA